jgi:UDP-N-acetylmuramoylalanine--D-glutamate ligase
MNREFFTGKKVLVMGLGRFGGGIDVAKFAASAGAAVTVTDMAPANKLYDSIGQLEGFTNVQIHLGSHEAADFIQADIIVANPAVASDNEYLTLAHRHNKIITSQIGIFFQLCPATIIGITGANGKSTTAALTAHLLEYARHETRNTRYGSVWLSGNIGNKPLLMTLGQIRPDDLVVLELSSFQLEQLAQIRKAPKVALLTNLTPNHLDRYGTFDEYCAAKENVFKYQNLSDRTPAVSIFNAEDEIGDEWFKKYKSDANRKCTLFSTRDISPKIRESFQLPGQANLENLAAAMAVTRYFSIDEDAIRTVLPAFRALPHRLELVAQKNKMAWYNDSKATTPQGAIVALEAFEEPKIIIAGGYDKNIPFDELGKKIANKAKAAILLGQTAEKIAAAIRNISPMESGAQIHIVGSLRQAVEKANRLAMPGDVVLLSPACASYDIFDNYEQRGRTFAKLVQEMIS